MAIIFYLLAASFVIPAGIYFYFFFRRFLTLFGIEKKTKKSRALAALLAAAVAALGIRMFDFSFMIMLHLLLACFFMELANFLLKRIPQKKFQKVWTFLYKSGIVCIALTVVVLTYGYFNMHDVQRTEYTIETAKAVGGDLKVVQISDLHVGTSLDEQEMRDCFARVQAEKADLLVLTGDIFDETTTRSQMKETVKMLSRIKTTYGAYYIFGNHDVNQYTTPAEMAMIMEYAMSNEVCAKVLGTYQYTTASTPQHPDGIHLTSTMFSRMVGNEVPGVTIKAGKTGYTDEAHNCLVNFAEKDGKEYVTVMAAAGNRWYVIFDGFKIYERYLP